MELQERSDPVSWAIGVDVSSVHRSLLSTTGAAFAASFHRDAQACRGTRERQQLHEIYRDKILAIDGIAANVAAAFLPFLHPVCSPEGGNNQRWGDFDRLAQRGKRMRDHESQYLQHQSGIIAAWGLECFEYYCWHDLPLPLLRQLRDLAVLMPHWADVVDLLNSRMLARHELRVLHGNNKALRVGEHSAASKVQAPHSPVERSDILAALKWAQTKATSAAARQEVKKSAQRINGHPIRQFGLKLDVFGMVVPSTDEDAEEGDDEANEHDYDADHLRPLTRPTKRTRLSFHSDGSSTSPKTAAKLRPRKNRARRGENSVARDSDSPETEAPEPEESQEPKESAAQPEDQIAVNGPSRDQHPTAQGLRLDEREDDAFQPESPDRYAVVRTRGNSSSGLEEMKDTSSDEMGHRSANKKTPKVLSWSEKDEESVSDANERAEEMAGLGASEHGSFRDEGVLEGSIVDYRSTRDEAEEEEEMGSTSRDEHGLDTDDEDEGDGERVRRLEAQFIERSLKGPTAGPETVYGQKQGLITSMSEGSASKVPNPPVADRNAAMSRQATAAAKQPKHRHLAVPSGYDNIQRYLTAEDAPPLEELVPPQLRPTLLQDLQGRHADAVGRLVEDLGRPQASEDVVRRRRLQLDWIGPQRWARIYAEPEDCMGRSCVTCPADADVWYLSWDAFRNYAESGYVFRRPVVIKQEFQDSGMYDIVDYVDMLWQRFPEQQVDVQNSMTGAYSSMSLAEYCLAVADADLSSSDAAAAISSATNLRRLARADEPLLSRLPRFRLLSTLADRVAGTFSRGGHVVPNDVRGCLAFNLLCFAGAFSGSYVETLVGSWTRCLSGVQIVAVATDLDAEDWRRFSQEGRDWSPRGQGRMIILEQDDVLLMPPGLRVARATFAPEPCLMEGGMLWDECAIPEILEELLWVVDNRACADESIHVALQLSPLIDVLEKWLDDENYIGQPSSRVTAAEQLQTVKAGIRSLRALLRSSP